MPLINFVLSQSIFPCGLKYFNQSSMCLTVCCITVCVCVCVKFTPCSFGQVLLSVSES